MEELNNEYKNEKLVYAPIQVTMQQVTLDEMDKLPGIEEIRSDEIEKMDDESKNKVLVYTPIECDWTKKLPEDSSFTPDALAFNSIEYASEQKYSEIKEDIPPTIVTPSKSRSVTINVDIKKSEIYSDYKEIYSGYDDILCKMDKHYEIGNKIEKPDVYLHYLILEDETIKPVFIPDERYTNTIKKWYRDCNIGFELEKTDIKIQENIINDIEYHICNKTFNINEKENFETQFITNFIGYFTEMSEIKKTYIETINKSIRKIYNINKPKCIFHDKFKKDIEIIKNNEFSKYKTIDKIETQTHSRGERLIKYSDYIKNAGINVPELVYNPSNPFLHKPYENKRDKFTADEMISKISDNFTNLSPIATRMNPLLELRGDFMNGIYINKDDSYIHSLEEYENTKLKFSMYENKPKIENKNTEVYVIINYKEMSTLVLENPSSTEYNTILDYPEFYFILLFKYETNDYRIIENIKTLFHKSLCMTIEKINNKFIHLHKYIDFCKELDKIDINSNNDKDEYTKKIIISYINNTYNLDNNINNRTKANDLLSDIYIIYKSLFRCAKGKESERKIGDEVFYESEVIFRTRLSKYFTELGLCKKRYSDGYYYYGITKKTTEQRYEELKSKAY